MVKDIECFKRKEEEDEEEEVLLFTDNRYSSVNRKMNEKSWSLRDLHWSIQYLGKEFLPPKPPNTQNTVFRYEYCILVWRCLDTDCCGVLSNLILEGLRKNNVQVASNLQFQKLSGLYHTGRGGWILKLRSRKD